MSTPAGDHPSAAPPTASSTASAPTIARTHGFEVAEPVGLAVGAGKVWSVSVHDGDVVGRSSATGPAATRVHVGTTPLRAVYDGRLLWVSVFGADQVAAIDPADGHVVRRVHTPGQPEGLVAAFGGVWVVRQLARLLTRIADDGTVGPSYRLGEEPRLVTADAHHLFASNFADGTVTRIDPGSGAARTSSHLCRGAQDLAVLDSTLWVSCTPDDTVVAVDIGTMRETGSVKITGEPDVLRVDGSALYVVTTNGPTLVGIDPDPRHPAVESSNPLGTAPPLGDIANVDAVKFHGDWWVSSPVANRVIVFRPHRRAATRAASASGSEIGASQTK